MTSAILLRIRSFRRLLASPARVRSALGPGQHWALAQRAAHVVRAFYLFNITAAFSLAQSVYASYLSGPPPDPLWPIVWLRNFDPAVAAKFLVFGLMVSSFLAVWSFRVALFRVLAAAFVVMAVAYGNSYGATNHGWHYWLWLSVVFAFCPALDVVRADRATRHWRHGILTVFFSAQLLMGLFYTLSGLHKARFGVQVGHDSVSSFVPNALEYLATNRWLANNYETVLQEFFSANPWIGWPAHLFVIYVEAVCLIAVFRPELHRLWGAFLLAFHATVWLLMNISFQLQPMSVALLFIMSPFAPKRVSPAGLFYALPLFGDVAWYINRRLVAAPKAVKAE